MPTKTKLIPNSPARKPVQPAALPTVHKTLQMLEVEATCGGRDIRLILKDLYEQYGSQSEVARALGVE